MTSPPDPIYYGFNFQWMFSALQGQTPAPPDEKALDFLAECGFNFVRLPVDYHFWIHDFDYFHPEQGALAVLDRYLEACRSRGIHLSLSLHRAPGYCINGNELERDNLWLDPVAQEAFAFQWRLLAQRFLDVPAEALSFNLINEPPDVGQFDLTRENHAAVIRRAVKAIRRVDPSRPLVIDGLDGGNLAVPELIDLAALHSTRGYQPMPITHHQATWWSEHASAPQPVYPGLQWRGQTWDRQGLAEFYAPWRDVEAQGVTIHVGELGCFDTIPNDLALRWFADVLAVFHQFGWGYAMWNFAGNFGLIDHRRPGARFETIHGYRVDRDLLELLLEHRSG